MPIVARAGDAIMRIYDSGFTVQRKEDNSPLTLADLESQRIIIEGLTEVSPGIPILSEESAQAPWDERKTWHELWVVDPLDGTREFVKRNGEKTKKKTIRSNKTKRKKKKIKRIVSQRKKIFNK